MTNTAVDTGAAGVWRVTVGSKSFDLERFAGTDKDGGEIWSKAAYARSRTDLERILTLHGLSADLASGVPKYHPDAYRALALFTESPAARPAMTEEHKAKMQAAKRRKKELA